jgi:hypothetical protein
MLCTNAAMFLKVVFLEVLLQVCLLKLQVSYLLDRISCMLLVNASYSQGLSVLPKSW